MTRRVTREAVQRAVAGVALVRRVYYFDELSSTSDWARDLAIRSGPDADLHGTLIVAAHQTAGRGRHGRRWFAPPGTALLLTLMFDPARTAGGLPPDEAAGLVAMAGPVAVCEALAKAAGPAVNARIKWPNDVMLGGAKAAGLLIELSAVARRFFINLGIGVNVNQPSDAFPPDLGQPAASLLTATGRQHDPGSVLEAILKGLDRYLIPGESARVAARMTLLCDTVGKTVEIRTADGWMTGTALAITDAGALVVRDGTGRLFEIHSAEVRHCRPG
ncbi:MAG: biotin--[acetyl-CoA-carboxylase] ligase [Candidatus Sumerlaeaceae bacterium]|nr:biotin--[acetyl-CoA-carboxylase] ligase [Candidatus Sumerlaeaceae bacterium]